MSVQDSCQFGAMYDDGIFWMWIGTNMGNTVHDSALLAPKSPLCHRHLFMQVPKRAATLRAEKGPVMDSNLLQKSLELSFSSTLSSGLVADNSSVAVASCLQSVKLATNTQCVFRTMEGPAAGESSARDGWPRVWGRRLVPRGRGGIIAGGG